MTLWTMLANYDRLRRERWSEAFSNSALKKGIEFQQQGHVSELSISEDRQLVGGTIFDTVSFKVQVRIKIDKEGRRWVNGFCSCAAEFNCKHSAAVMIAALAEAPDLLEPRNGQTKSEPVAEGVTPAVPVPLPPAISKWVGLLEAANRKANGAVEERKVHVLYLLSMRKTNHRRVLVVSTVSSRVRKDGSYGRSQDQLLESALKDNPPRVFTHEDVRIARRAYASGCLDYGPEFCLDADDAPELLDLMIQTGRCHWCAVDSPPLRMGQVRPGRPIWVTDDRGYQEASFAAEPPATEILPVEPPWYVDLNDHTLAPLETAMPAAVASAWLAAPSISPVEAVHLNSALSDRLRERPLPRAQALEVEELNRCEPKGCLRFTTVRLQWWEAGVSFEEAGLDGKLFHLARVSFDYAGLRVPFEDDETNLIEQVRGGKLVRIHRFRRGEEELVDRLFGYNLVPALDVIRVYGRKEFEDAWALKNASDEAWFKFSLETLPKLQAAGWTVEYDNNFAFHIAAPSEWYAELEPEDSGNDWFGVELGVQVDQDKINLLPVLLEVLQSRNEKFSLTNLAKLPAKRLVAVPLGDGRTLPFPVGRLRDILAVLVELHDPNSLNKNGRLQLPRLRAAELATIGDEGSWRWHGGDALRELGQKLKDFRGIQRVEPPRGLMATLRPYQLDGVSWLQFLREYNLSGILADDMGLGKTVQALAHVLAEKESGRLDRPALVVAPTSLMTNWRQEAERFAPELRVFVSHGSDRKQQFDKLADHDLVVTSYSLLHRDAEILLAQQYHMVMLDEAQYVKNPKSKFAQVACQLRARHQLCLTGTPMENHLGELWSLFNFLMPGFLGDEQRFRTLFRNPIEKGANQERRELLARRVAPFILRRRKEEVALELPPKTEITQNVELNGAQRDLYESIRLAMHAKVKAEVEKKGMNRSHIIILDALLKLRQVCCDPRLVPLEQARKVKESAKLELLMDLLPEMIAEGRRILLFSQFTSMLELIEVELETAGIEYVKLTGETVDRATPVNRFQSCSVPLFLISLKAGGTGLNLTAADTVIHYDPWWNPAVENQATDRAHRIGQDKKVFVYKFMTVGTVEEKILALQSRKRELVDGLINAERKDKLQLSSDDLDVLFAPLG